MNLRSLTLMVACFAIVGLATAPGQAAWDITEIDDGPPVRLFNSISMAVLDWGQPAVAYQGADGSLQYAWFDLSTWHITTVDPCLGVDGPGSGSGDMMPSLAILPSGQPAISYMGCQYSTADNQFLKYAWFDDVANSWQTIEVDEVGNWGSSSTCLKVLPSGRVAIAWYAWVEDTSQNTLYLKYAEGDAQGASWTISTVDTINTIPDDSMVLGGLNACSMAVLSSGQPAIAYQTADYTLHYAAYNGSSWNKSVVDSKLVTGFSLAVIHEDQPYISYVDLTDMTPCYAWYDSATATWTPTRFVGLTSGQYFTSLARQPSGDPAIVFTNQDYQMMYLRHDGNEWQISTVDPTGNAPSLVFLPNGQAAIAYRDHSWVKYAVETAAGGSDDSDGDGFPDSQDNCPSMANADQADSDGDGTGDACDDGSNSTDECPDDPNKVAPGLCGCGTPDTDSDGDGLADCIDDGSDPTDECPDSDGDGLGDCLDDCPYDPDKIVEGFCGCGYADTDSDGDGLADCAVVTPPSTHPGGAAVGACGAGIVETLTLTALAMFVVQPIRRRR